MITRFSFCALWALSLLGQSLTPTNTASPVNLSIAPGSTRPIIYRFASDSTSAVKNVDVLFILDLSSSSSGAVSTYQSQVAAIMQTLQSSFSRARFAVASFKDFPLSPFGNPAGGGYAGDYPYRLEADFTDSQSAINDKLRNLEALNGGDTPESQLVATYQAVTGIPFNVAGTGYSNCGAALNILEPGVTFAENTTRVIILYTDANFHTPSDIRPAGGCTGTSTPYPGPSFAQVSSVLANNSISLIGINTGSSSDLSAIATAAPAGGFDCSTPVSAGNAMVCPVGGVSATGIKNTISRIITSSPNNGTLRLAAADNTSTPFNETTLISSITPGPTFLNLNAGVTTDYTVTYTCPSTASGTYTFNLQAIFDSSVLVSSPVTIACQSGGGGVLTVAPSTVTLTAGQTQQFTASLSGTATTAVTWAVEPSTAGSISTGGLYTAPTSFTAGQTATIRATHTSAAAATATVTLQQAATSCLPVIAPTSIDAAAGVTSGNLTLTLSGGCAWTANTNSLPWITLNRTSGSGGATIGYTISANSTRFGRSGILTIAGLNIPVRQGGSDCTSSLSTTFGSFPATASNGSVALSVPPGCTANASANAGFVRNITASNGTLAFALDANTGGARSAIITVTTTSNALTYTVNQRGVAAPNFSCSAVPPAANTVRAGGRTELLADLDIQCSGRTAGLLLSGDIVLTLNNANFTSRITDRNKELTEATLSLTNGGAFAGRIEGMNGVRFAGIPLSTGEPEVALLRMRITKVRADVSLLGAGAAVTATVDLQSPVAIPVTTPTQTLGTVNAALSFLRGSNGGATGQRTIPLTYQEGYANVFRTRDGEAGSASADNATRLQLRVSGLPSAAQVFVTDASTDANARLIDANGTPVSGAPRLGGSYAPLTVNGGVAIAQWEITAGNTASIESRQFTLLIEGATDNQLSTVQLEGALAPLSSIVTASDTAPIPRFADAANPVALVNLALFATAPSSAATGNTVTINYRTQNQSEVAANGVLLRANLSEGLYNPTCAGATCTVDGQTVRIDMGNLAPSEERTATVTVSVSGIQGCPNCDPKPKKDAATGLGTCPDCIGNGSVLPVAATASLNQSDPQLANNTSTIGITVNEACSAGFSRAVLTAGSGGVNLRVEVIAGPSCDWTVTGVPSWITGVPSSSSRGSATLNLAVAANNSTDSRSASLTLGVNTLRIVQAALGCNITVNGPGSVPVTGGAVSVTISAPGACSWEVTGGPDWLKLPTQRTGSGNATLTFTADPNAAIIQRTAFVEVAGQSIALVQPAGNGTVITCSYTLTPSAAIAPQGGGGATIAVTTTPACSWTATSNVPWITISTGSAGTGSGTVTYSVAANTGAQRSGIITIAGQSVSVLQAGTVDPGSGTGLRFVALEPCRVMETRAEYNFQGRTGSFGPPYVRAGETRSLIMANSNVCQIPAAAKAYVLNVTLIPRGAADFVTLWPAGEPRPDFWTVRSPDGQIVANSAIVKSGSGVIQAYSSNDVDMIIDITGYFTDDSRVSNLVYYPLTPCRVVDTRADYRSPAGPFGPPQMNARETRNFRFPATPYCSIPAGAAAYSVTITAVPPAALAYLTAWPAGGSQPNVSNINSPAGRVLANSVILPASSDGSISVFTYDRTDFLIDINGYFAPDDGSRGLYYYPVTQCRISDSRNANGTFGGPIFADETARTIPVPASACAGIPLNAKAYAMNATAIPNGNSMPFLTLWPTAQDRPNISVLNAFQGQTVTNSAIIPAGSNGSIEAFAFRRSHVVLEISGYFNR